MRSRSMNVVPFIRLRHNPSEDEEIIEDDPDSCRGAASELLCRSSPVIRDLNVFCAGGLARSLVTTGSLTPVDGSFERFMVSLDPLKDPKLNDHSPRDNRPTTLRWRTGLSDRTLLWRRGGGWP